MRTTIGCLAVLGFLGLARPVMAQATASTILGGAAPSSLTFKPIDMSHAIAPSPALAAQQNRFNFTALFSKLSMPSYPGKRGISPMPVPSSFPSSKYSPFKMVGTPPRLIGDPKTTAMPMNVPTPYIPSMKTPVGPGSNN